MKIEELKKVLEENGYKLVYIMKFKTHDRIRIEKRGICLILNFKKHIEEVPIEVLTEYLGIKKEGVKSEVT
jgi:hypothetical protein